MRNGKFIIFILAIILLSINIIACSDSNLKTSEEWSILAKNETTVEVTTTTKGETTTTANTTIDNSNVKYGLTEAQRKQAYYDLAVLQDSIAVEDPPDRSEKMTEAYSIIAKKYDITKDEMLEITAGGIEKNWPMPLVE